MANIDDRIQELTSDLATELRAVIEEEVLNKIRISLGVDIEPPSREPRRKSRVSKKIRRGRPPKPKLNAKEEAVFTVLKKAGKPLTSVRIGKAVGLMQSGVNRHLSNLVKKRVVKRVREGRNVYYQTP